MIYIKSVCAEWTKSSRKQTEIICCMPDTVERCIKSSLWRWLTRTRGATSQMWKYRQPKIFPSWPRSSRVASGMTWSATLEAFQGAITLMFWTGAFCSELSSGITALSCHIVKADILYFLANRRVHWGRRLTALIGGYPFVCSGNVRDNRREFKRRRGKRNGKREW